jgi:hypothetical protein
MGAGSADTIYRVLTVYDVDTRDAERGAGSLAIIWDHVLNLLDRVKDKLAAVISLHSEAESARVAIAGLLSAGDLPGAKNFQMAMAMSAEIIAKMRKDARELPGEFADLQNIFQFSILGGSQAGKSVNDIESMSAKMMAVTKGLGISSEFAGREFAELMEGRASSRVTLFAKLKNLMGDPHMDAAKFNALSATEKWEKIQKALESFGPMISEYGKTWEAVSSTAEDYLRNIMRIGSSGVFETLKRNLQEANEWYERNEKAIMAVSSAIFDGIGNAIGTVYGIFKEMVLVVADVLDYFGLFNNSTQTIRDLGDAIGLALTAVIMIKGATLAWEGAQWALNLAMAANPLGIMIALVAALAAGIAIVVSYMEDMRDTWIILTNDPAFAKLASHMGIDIVDGALSGKLHSVDRAREAEMRMAERQNFMKDAYGDNGPLAHLKMLVGAGGKVGEAGDHPIKKLMEFGIPGLFTPSAATFNAAHKPPTGAKPEMNVNVKIEQTINSNEGADRLLVVTKKAIRETLDRPTRTFLQHVF